MHQANCVKAGRYAEPEDAGSHRYSFYRAFVPCIIVKSMNLNNRSCIVTGGTRGIGRAIAKMFLAHGARVVLCGRSEDAVREAVAELASENPGKVNGKVADVRVQEQVTELFRFAEAFLGGLDVLVNNAGINVFHDPLSMPEEEWKRCFAVDLEGVWHCTRAVLPGMRAHKKGTVVNIASVHSFAIIPNTFPYPVAKHGLLGLTRSLGIQYAADGVRVNAICPGWVRTPLVERQIPDQMKTRNMTEEQVKRDVLLAAQPTKQFVTIEQVASLALYLASDAAANITGITTFGAMFSAAAGIVVLRSLGLM